MSRRLAVVAMLVMVIPTLLPSTLAERGPPFVPDPPTGGEAIDSGWENVTNTFFRTAGTTPILFHEGFEGPGDLASRGWSEEVLAQGSGARPIWKVVERNDTLAAKGERTAIAPAGAKAASVFEDFGTNRDSRLVSPPIDLRFVTGASGETDVVGGQPTLQGVIDTAKDVLSARLADSAAKDATAVVRTFDASPSDRALVSDREGVGLVNLTFFHLWDLAQDDKAWLDIRTRENGSWTSWQPLTGDLVFETEVDYATLYQNSAYCDAHRGFQTAAAKGPSSLLVIPKYCDDARLSLAAALANPLPGTFRDDGSVDPNTWGSSTTPAQMPTSLSGALETILEPGQYPPVYYNDLSEGEDGRPHRHFSGASQDIDGSLIVRKSHFTLNRFIGKEIQVAFHIRSGPATSDAQYGWFVDEVEVRASVPERDPGVNAITFPEPGDVLADGARLRPVAKIANNGRFEVRDVNVTFSLTDDAGRSLLRETQRIPRLGGISSQLVATNALSEALRGGQAYHLNVSLVLPSNPKSPAANGSFGAPVQIDANPRNNADSITFAVRTVRDVRVYTDVPPEAIMTDVDAPKEGIKVRVVNRGNVDATGVLNVTVHEFNSTTRSVGPPLEVLLSETLPASELPFGKDLNGLGSSSNVAVRTFDWTGRAPGIYVLRAVFHDAATGQPIEAAEQSVFVRKTPTSNLGPLSISPNIKSPAFPDLHVGAVEQICIDADRKNCFTSWGYAGEVVGSSGAQSNSCGYTTGDVGQQERPPLCPLPSTKRNLGTTDGEWAWVATHDDRFVETFKSHGTNILDEGILEYKMSDFGPHLIGRSERLYVSFRHLGQFNWSQIDDNFANPNGFRGQFRILEDTRSPLPVGDPDATDGPQRIDPETDETAPVEDRNTAQERLLFSVNFTEPVRWERAVIDLTPVLAKMKSGERKNVQIQWVAQTTPASVVPDWRIGETNRDRSGEIPGTAPQECSTAQALGLCSLFDPLHRWALDSIIVFGAPPSANPYPPMENNAFVALFSSGAETHADASKFTDCAAALDPSTGRHKPDSESRSAEAPTAKCRHWQRERHYQIPTMWHLDITQGKGVDGSPRLRWGNPQGAIDDTAERHQDGRSGIEAGFYTILQTPRFDLHGTQAPALAFDQWHSFQLYGIDVDDPFSPLDHKFPTEGGNVWISGYDEDGVRVLHEILFPSPSSEAQYTSGVPYHGVNEEYAFFRGVEPEWSANYTKMRNVNSAFVQNSGGGSEAAWNRAVFDLSRYASPSLVDLRYAVEFHAFQYNASERTTSKGWRIDNIEVRESNVANDVGVAEILSPPSFVGPDVEQPVVIRVRNDGFFAQKAVRVNYTVYLDGDLVQEPVVATLPYGGPGDELPGRLQTDKPDKNATFPFPVSWTPTRPGVYTLVARTELEGSVDRLPDENPLNDVLTKVIVVQENHDVFVHDGTQVPDQVTVSPFIGPVGEPRSFSFVVENAGTVPERFLGASESLFRVDVDIFGEDGKSVLASPLRQNLRELLPGQKVVVRFPDSWVPTASGVYDIVARIVYPVDELGRSKDLLTDNTRTVKVLVFDVELPAAGENISTEFVPDDISLWGHNASRYAGSDGWSLPPDFEYPGSIDTSLVLERVLNLHSARSSFLRINQSFDFERTYDGGRVEMSLDGGRTWSPVSPLQSGGWEPMSTASPFVTDPTEPAYAWTGQGQGTWEINLGSLDGLHTTATLLEDDFQDAGLPQLRANVTVPWQRVAATPSGTTARFAAVPTTDPHEVAVQVEAARGGADAAILAVWAQPGAEPQGQWHRMKTTVGSGRYWLAYPQTYKEVGGVAYRDDRATPYNLPMTPAGSVFRFRVYTQGDPVPVESGSFMSTPTGLIALPAAREVAFRSAPGQQVLWSDKYAILCKASLSSARGFGSPFSAGSTYPAQSAAWVEDAIPSTRTACRGYDAPNALLPHILTRYQIGGPVQTRKYVEAVVDVTGFSDPQGSLRVSVRDTAFLPPAFEDGGLGSRPSRTQTVRVVVDVDGGQALVRDPLQAGTSADTYWNWTDRVIVFQGSEWKRMLEQPADPDGRKRVTVRLEHVVQATTSGDTPDATAIQSMHLGTTDEYGPHFGWGLASVAVDVVTPSGSTRLTRLDAATLTATDGQIKLPEGWTQGATSTFIPRNSLGQIVGPEFTFYYPAARDVLSLTTEPFAKDVWRQASAVEWTRPSPGVVNRTQSFVNRFWEANSSRLPDEVAGGAARLIMPLDLKSAVGTTTLAFNTQFSFRQAKLASEPAGGASGGRVEISTDDGATWEPLIPIDAAKAPVAPTPHRGQVLDTGEPRIPSGPRYGRMFENPRMDGIANHFEGDSVFGVGMPSEFGSANKTPAFTGRPSPLNNQEYERMDTHAPKTQKFRDWAPVAFDLTPYYGRDVLIGFHATFSGSSIASLDPGANNYYLQNRDFWRIDDLKVVGEVFQGSDVRLRLRAASDATVGGSGWDVRDLQVLSQKHQLNLGARIVAPTPEDDLHVGENPFVVEVANKGVLDVEDIEVAISVTAIGDGAPPPRTWTGKLSDFTGCGGEPVPADGGLAKESVLRLCGTVANGTLTFLATPEATYTFSVLATHRAFGEELLVGDNQDRLVIYGDQVIVRDTVQVQRLTILPSVIDRAERRPVTVTASLALEGFDRADVSAATLDLLGDPEVPVHLELDDASSFDPRFTEPGRTRTLSWTIPRETVDALRDGVYTAQVKVFTADVPQPSVAEAPLYKGTSIRPIPGFLFQEPVDHATMTVAMGPAGQAGSVDTGPAATEPSSRNAQCRDDPRGAPHRWCSYHTSANETTNDPFPSPYQAADPAGDSQWMIRPVIPDGPQGPSEHPSAKQHGNVFDLMGFKNVCSKQLDGNGNPGPCVPHFRAVSLESPPIDIRDMGGSGAFRTIGVQFSERHDFGDQGIFAKVYIAPWELGTGMSQAGKPILYMGSPSGEPVPKDKGWIDLGTITGRSSGNSDYQFVTFSADAGAAIGRNWTEAMRQRPSLPETYEWVKVRIVLYMPPDASFTTFQVDDINVGPFASTLGPMQSIPLNDDTDKTYTYLLKNVGGFSDVLNVTFRKPDGSRTLLPTGWNVTLLDEDGTVLDQLGPAPSSTDRCTPVTGARKDLVELASGDVRRLSLKVCIPVTSGQPGRTGFAPVDITAFSQKLPGLVAGSALNLDYSYLNRANLKVVGLRTNADVPVDQPRQVVVEVHNTGTLAACEASIGLVDRRKDEADVEVYGASGLRPDVGLCSKRPDGVLEGGLPPGEGRQFRFMWTPHGVGEHELVAFADPLNEISELSEQDNVMNQTLDIRLPSFPDVVARVSVSDDEPNIGDAVRVSLSLTNVGGAAAQSVNVTMKVGVTDLLGGFNEGLVPRIGPGETVWLNKTWRAVFPGKVLLYVNALPRDGVLERVETQGNNLVVQPLFVRSQGLDVTAKVVGIQAAPGEAREIGFIISNNGDTPDAYDLVLDAPRGVRASIFLDGAKVESVSLANRTSRNLTAIVDLPAEFPAGDVMLGLRAVSQNTTQARVAQFTLSVKALYGFFLEAAQAEAKPGRVEVPLALTNLGNAKDAFEVDVLNAPPGWKALPSSGTVDPYAKGTATLVLEVPTTTPRGIYEVLARVRDHAGTEATAVVGVTLLDYQAAVPTFEVARAIVRPSTLVPTTLTLANEGNVRAETSVRVEAPAGWRAEVDRPSLVLEPGEKAEVLLSVVVPATAPFRSVGEVKVVTTSGGVERVASYAVEVGESDLHVLELDYAPRVGLQPDSKVNFTAVVRNDGGLDARDVGVAFYVDDLLAGYETVGDLPAGGERTVSFRWSAAAGEHVILAILDPGNTVRETDEANNARLEVVRVSRTVGILSAAREEVPGVGVFASLAAVAAVAAVLARKRTR